MANRAASYTQADVSRLVKGAISGGLLVREVIATKRGVRLICVDEDTDISENSIDKILDDEDDED